MSPDKPKILYTALWCVLGALATASFGAGFRNAIRSSSDFQWSGAHLLAHRVDPYRVMLQGNPNHQLLMNQVPNYLHEFYVLLLPLGMMSFGAAKYVWAALNTCFAVTALAMLASIYELSISKAVLLGLLLVISTPFRIAIGTGQNCLLELTLLTFALRSPRRSGLALGLSYFKYSFSPIFFFYALWRRAWRQLAISMAVAVAGLVTFWLIVGGRFIEVVEEPFRVSRYGTAIADADLVSLTTLLHPAWKPVSIAIGILVSGVLAWAIVRLQRPLKSAAAALATACLTLLPHGTYDFVMLVVPAALLMSVPKRGARVWIGAGCIAALWYLFKFLPLTEASRVFWLLVRMALLGGVFMTVLDRPERSSQAELS